MKQSDKKEEPKADKKVEEKVKAKDVKEVKEVQAEVDTHPVYHKV